MSTHSICVIPRDPFFIPDAQAQAHAQRLLQQLAPRADSISILVSHTPIFVDAGANFETVKCPRCRTAISNWWHEAMDRAYSHQFKHLAVETPCCATTLSLNELRYEWPCGFARFVLKAQNPDVGLLSVVHMRALERLLNCCLRQILAHV
ncbi:MAG: hypothetical protein MUD01_03805 [Chloroflexaceae bacterium]|nr:hypothetical protein [Chloroflexaceae bacterium]